MICPHGAKWEFKETALGTQEPSLMTTYNIIVSAPAGEGKRCSQSILSGWRSTLQAQRGIRKQ